MRARGAERMVETWRLLDTGLASAARNVALNRAVLEAREADEIASTLRFVRHAPCALLASGHSASHELDTAACAAEQVPVQRRITGGAAWYADERQLGWELYLHRRDVGSAELRAVSKRLAHAAAAGLSALGVDARCRGDEIEVDGRTVCWTARAAEGDGVLLQALLLVDADFERMSRVLRMPACAPGHTPAVALRARVADLKSLLGRHADLRRVKHNIAEAFESEFDVEFREADLSLTEHSRYERALREIDTAGWVGHMARPAAEVRSAEAIQRLRAGELRAAVRYDVKTRTVRQVWFSGDIVFKPARARWDLEAALRDIPLDAVARRVEWFFSSRPAAALHAEPRDFVAAVRLAAGQPLTA